MPLEELQITQNFGSSYAIADVSGDVESVSRYCRLLQILLIHLHSATMMGPHLGTMALKLSKSSGGYFTQSYIKNWHGDSSADGNDYVVFSAGSNWHGDWSGYGNVGAVGAEFRMGGNSSDTNYYSVWIR